MAANSENWFFIDGSSADPETETGSYDLSLIRGEVTLSLLWVASSLEVCNEMPEVPA
jgi:hypothetical protein